TTASSLQGSLVVAAGSCEILMLGIGPPDRGAMLPRMLPVVAKPALGTEMAPIILDPQFLERADDYAPLKSRRPAGRHPCGILGNSLSTTLPTRHRHEKRLNRKRHGLRSSLNHVFAASPARAASYLAQRIESRVALLIGRRGSRERHRLRSSINHVRRLAGTLRQFIPDPPQSAAPVSSSSPTMARTFCRFDWPQRARQGRDGRATVQFTMLGAMPRGEP